MPKTMEDFLMLTGLLALIGGSGYLSVRLVHYILRDPPPPEKK